MKCECVLREGPSVKAFWAISKTLFQKCLNGAFAVNLVGVLRRGRSLPLKFGCPSCSKERCLSTTREGKAQEEHETAQPGWFCSPKTGQQCTKSLRRDSSEWLIKGRKEEIPVCVGNQWIMWSESNSQFHNRNKEGHLTDHQRPSQSFLWAW